MFGWSFVFEDFVSDELRNKVTHQMEVRGPGLPRRECEWVMVLTVEHHREAHLRAAGGGVGGKQKRPPADGPWDTHSWCSHWAGFCALRLGKKPDTCRVQVTP